MQTAHQDRRNATTVRMKAIDSSDTVEIDEAALTTLLRDFDRDLLRAARDLESRISICGKRHDAEIIHMLVLRIQELKENA